MSTIITVEVNCPDDGTAAVIAEALVAERLAACANVHAPVESVYRWGGRSERRIEVPLVLKTRAEHFPALVEAVRALHPYEVPSIVAQPVSVPDDYREWVEAETAEAGEGHED